MANDGKIVRGGYMADIQAQTDRIQVLEQLLRERPPKHAIDHDLYWKWSDRVKKVIG